MGVKFSYIIPIILILIISALFFFSPQIQAFFGVSFVSQPTALTLEPPQGNIYEVRASSDMSASYYKTYDKSFMRRSPLIEGASDVEFMVKSLSGEGGESFILENPADLSGGESEPLPEIKGYIVEFKEKPILQFETERKEEIEGGEERVEKLKQEYEDIKIEGLNIINPFAWASKIGKGNELSNAEAYYGRLEENFINDVEEYKGMILTSHENFKNKMREEGFPITGMATAKGSASEGDKILGEYQKVFNGIALDISEEDAERLKDLPEVEDVHPNLPVNLTLAESVPLINADDVWKLQDSQGRNITGQNITIAIIDTGIDYTHSDLGGCFGPNCKVIGGYDFVNNDNDPMDDQGHGTHCAGIATGNGNITGVAPDAKLYAYKVLSADGRGSFDDVIAGIERSVDPDQDGNFSDHVDVISMSLGASCWGTYNEDCGPDDPVSIAVDNAVNAGVVAAIAAGNDYSEKAIGSPGTSRKAITVGATDKYDNIADFSSKGPVVWANGSMIKPDVMAPGVSIYSSVPKGSCTLCSPTGYKYLRGTSMATPHVAGAAALLLQAHPDWGPDEVKSALMTTSKDLGEKAWHQGTGRIDVLKAYSASIFIDPQTISFGNVLGQEFVSGSFKIKNLKSENLQVNISADRLYNDAGNIYEVSTVNTSQLDLGAGETGYVKLTTDVRPITGEYFYGFVKFDDGSNVYRVSQFMRKVHEVNLELVGSILEENTVDFGFLVYNDDFSKLAYAGSFWDFIGNNYTFELPPGKYTAVALGEQDDNEMIHEFAFVVKKDFDVGGETYKKVTLNIDDTREFELNCKTPDGIAMDRYDWIIFFVHCKNYTEHPFILDVFDGNCTSTGRGWTGFGFQGEDVKLYLSEFSKEENNTVLIHLGGVPTRFPGKHPANRGAIGIENFMRLWETPDLSDEIYFLNIEIQDTITGPDLIDYEKDKFAELERKSDYPGYQPIDSEEMFFFGSSLSFGAGGWGDAALPENKAIYAYSPNEYSWLKLAMFMNYIYHEDDWERLLLRIGQQENTWWLYNLTKDGYYYMTYPFVGENVPSDTLNFGVMPYSFANFSNTNYKIKFGNRYTHSVFSHERNANMWKSPINKYIPQGKLEVYLNGSLHKEQQFCFSNTWWAINLSLICQGGYQEYYPDPGDYLIKMHIPLVYPIMNNTYIDARFSWPGGDVNPPYLEHLEVSPRFNLNEQIKVEFIPRDDQGVGEVKMYYRTGNEWSDPINFAVGGSTHVTWITVTDPNAEEIDLKIEINDVNNNSIKYTFVPISMKERELDFGITLKSKIVDDREAMEFSGRLLDNGEGIEGLKVEFHINDEFHETDKSSFECSDTSCWYYGPPYFYTANKGDVKTVWIIPDDYEHDHVNLTVKFDGTGVYSEKTERHTFVIEKLPDVAVSFENIGKDYVVNKEYDITVKLKNIGSNDTGQVNIALYDNQDIVSQETVDSIQAGSETFVNFTWIPETQGYHELKVVAETPKDRNPDNNEDKAIINVYKQLVDVTGYIEMDWSKHIKLGEEIEINVTIYNNGIRNATDTWAKVYDHLPNGTDVLLWEETIGDLEPRTPVFNDLKFTFTWKPEKIGWHELQLVMNASNDENQENNRKLYTVIVHLEAPDVTGYMHHKPTVGFGEEVNISITVKNRGAENATNTTAKLYYTKQYKDNYKLIESFDVGMLSPTESAEIITSWKPEEAGGLILRLEVNCTGDSDLHNNVYHTYLSVVENVPDVSVSMYFDWGKKILVGKEFNASLSVRNIGAAEAKDVKVKLLYKKGYTKWGDTKNFTLIDEVDVGDLDADSWKKVEIGWTPEDWGPYTLLAMVNCTNETKYYNNINYGFVDVIPDAPDVTGRIIGGTGMMMYLLLDEEAKINVTARSVGTKTAENVTVSMYYTKGSIRSIIGDETILEEEDFVFIGKKELGEMPVDEMRDLNFSWKPNETGYFTLLAVFNCSGDENFKNNKDYRMVYVVPDAPEVIGRITWKTSYAIVNESNRIHFNVENMGGQEANNVNVSLYVHLPDNERSLIFHEMINLTSVFKKGGGGGGIPLPFGVASESDVSTESVSEEGMAASYYSPYNYKYYTVSWIPKEFGEHMIELMVNCTDDYDPSNNVDTSTIEVKELVNIIFRVTDSSGNFINNTALGLAIPGWYAPTKFNVNVTNFTIPDIIGEDDSVVFFGQTKSGMYGYPMMVDAIFFNRSMIQQEMHIISDFYNEHFEVENALLYFVHALDVSWDYSEAEIYADTNLSQYNVQNESPVSIYSCSDWEFDDKECESDWVSLNMSQQLLYSTYLSAKVDSTEAFGLGEFREAAPPPPPPPPPLVEFNWSEIKPGRVALVDITHPDIDFTKLFFRVNRKVINVRLSMRKLSSKPSGTPSMSGKSYKYFDINPVNIQDADLSEARINFKVRKSWINDNDIDEANIYLYRYHNDEWKRLETTKINEDSSYVYYRTNIPGFSFFAITGRATSPVCDNDNICDSGENTDNCPNDCQCNSGETRDCAVANLGICSVGGETCSNGRWTGCPSPQTETCNRKDDDCDGTVDDVNNGNSIASAGCQCFNDGQPKGEECNGVDDDCDGAKDENLERTCGPDNIKGACRQGTSSCVNGQWGDCIGAVYPEHSEKCGNNLDDNCDGQVNEGCETCYNGEQDGDEEGMDCGGSCTPCPADLSWIIPIIAGVFILFIVLFVFFRGTKKKEKEWDEMMEEEMEKKKI